MIENFKQEPLDEEAEVLELGVYNEEISIVSSSLYLIESMHISHATPFCFFRMTSRSKKKRLMIR